MSRRYVPLMVAFVCVFGAAREYSSGDYLMTACYLFSVVGSLYVFFFLDLKVYKEKFDEEMEGFEK